MQEDGCGGRPGAPAGVPTPPCLERHHPPPGARAEDEIRSLAPRTLTSPMGGGFLAYGGTAFGKAAPAGPRSPRTYRTGACSRGVCSGPPTKTAGLTSRPSSAPTADRGGTARVASNAHRGPWPAFGTPASSCTSGPSRQGDYTRRARIPATRRCSPPPRASSIPSAAALASPGSDS